MSKIKIDMKKHLNQRKKIALDFFEAMELRDRLNKRIKMLRTELKKMDMALIDGVLK